MTAADDGPDGRRAQPRLLRQLARARVQHARVVVVAPAPRRLPAQRHRVVRRPLDEQDPRRLLLLLLVLLVLVLVLVCC